MSTTDAITMITTFTVTGDADEFEQVFAGLAEFMQGKPGFRRVQLVRSVHNPTEYVALQWWDSDDAYRGMVRTAEFLLHHAELAELADVQADQAVEVAGGGADPDANRVVAITTFAVRPGVDPQQFVQGFVSHAGFMRAQPGFVTNSLVKSLRREETYTNIGWWTDISSYVAVLQSPQFRQDVKDMPTLADARGDLYRTVRSLAQAA